MALPITPATVSIADTVSSVRSDPATRELLLTLASGKSVPFSTVTRVGDGNTFLAYGHIAHDCVLGSHIVASNSFGLAGHVIVEDHVTLGAIMLAVVGGVVAITLAARRISIQIPQRTMARGRQREAAKNFIPLRINSAGVMPIIFANSLIVVPGALAQVSGSEKLRDFADYLAPGTWLYFLLSATLIVFFTYFYTSIIFNPIDLAENLKKQGGFIPGVKPGAKTAEYIDHVVSRITFPGAIFLTVIALLPVWIADFVNVTFRFGGTSLLIVVGVALDTLAQMNQHLLLRKYDTFMKKGRVRFRGRQGDMSF